MRYPLTKKKKKVNYCSRSIIKKKINLRYIFHLSLHSYDKVNDHNNHHVNLYFLKLIVIFLSMSKSINTLNNLNPQDVEQLTVLGITLGNGEVGKEVLYWSFFFKK